MEVDDNAAVSVWGSNGLVEIFGLCKSTTEVLYKVDEILLIFMKEQSLPLWTKSASIIVKKWTIEILDLNHTSSALRMLRLVTSYSCSNEEVDASGIIMIYQLFYHFAVSDAVLCDLHIQNEYWEVLNKLLLSLIENHASVVIMSFADLGGELISSVVNNSLPLLLKVIRLKELNELLKLMPIANRSMFRTQVRHNFKKLPRILKDVGDYDFQASLVEAIFRMTNSSQRSQEVSKWFPGLDCTIQSLFIRISDFDPDCRRFLNAFNNSLGPQQNVFSFPCEKAAIGQMPLVKPKVASYEKFWIDFNLGTRGILILCQRDWLEIPSYDMPWESIVIKEQDINEVTLVRTVHSFTLEFTLSSVEACIDLFFSQLSQESQKLLSNIILLEFSPQENLVNICSELFRNKLKIFAQEPQGWRTNDSRMNSSVSVGPNKLNSSAGKRRKSSASISILRAYGTSTSDPQTDISSDKNLKPDKKIEGSQIKRKHKNKKSPPGYPSQTGSQQGGHPDTTVPGGRNRSEKSPQANEDDVIPCSLNSQEHKRFTAHMNRKTSVSSIPITRKIESVTQKDVEVEILYDDNDPHKSEPLQINGSCNNDIVHTESLNRGKVLLDKIPDQRVVNIPQQKLYQRYSVTEKLISFDSDANESRSENRSANLHHKHSDKGEKGSSSRSDQFIKFSSLENPIKGSHVKKTSPKQSPNKQSYPALEFTSNGQLEEVLVRESPLSSKQMSPVTNKLPSMQMSPVTIKPYSKQMSPVTKKPSSKQVSPVTKKSSSKQISPVTKKPSLEQSSSLTKDPSLKPLSPPMKKPSLSEISSVKNKPSYIAEEAMVEQSKDITPSSIEKPPEIQKVEHMSSTVPKCHTDCVQVLHETTSVIKDRRTPSPRLEDSLAVYALNTKASSMVQSQQRNLLGNVLELPGNVLHDAGCERQTIEFFTSVQGTTDCERQIVVDSPLPHSPDDCHLTCLGGDDKHVSPLGSDDKHVSLLEGDGIHVTPLCDVSHIDANSESYQPYVEPLYKRKEENSSLVCGKAVNVTGQKTTPSEYSQKRNVSLSDEFVVYDSLQDDYQNEKSKPCSPNKDEATSNSVGRKKDTESSSKLAYKEGRKSPSSALLSTLKILAEYPVKSPNLATPNNQQVKEKPHSVQEQLNLGESGGMLTRRKKRKINSYPCLEETPGKKPDNMLVGDRKRNPSGKKKLFDTSAVEMFEASPPVVGGLPLEVHVSQSGELEESTDYLSADKEQRGVDKDSPNKCRNKETPEKFSSKEGEHQLGIEIKEQKKRRTAFFTRKKDVSSEKKENSSTVNKRKNPEGGKLSYNSEDLNLSLCKSSKRSKLKESPHSRKSNLSGGFLEFPEIQDSSPHKHSIYSDFSSGADTEHSWLYNKKSKKSEVSKTYPKKGKSFSRLFSPAVSSDDDWRPFKEKKAVVNKGRVSRSLSNTTLANGEKTNRSSKSRRCKKVTSYFEKSTDFETDHGSLNNSKIFYKVSKKNDEDCLEKIGSREQSPEKLRHSESSVDSGTTIGFRLAKKTGDAPKSRRDCMEIDGSYLNVSPDESVQQDIVTCFGFYSELEIVSPENNLDINQKEQHRTCEAREQVFHSTHNTLKNEVVFLEGESGLQESSRHRNIPSTKVVGKQTLNITEISEILPTEALNHNSPFGSPLQSTLIQDEDLSIDHTGRFSYVGEPGNDSIGDWGNAGQSNGISQNNSTEQQVVNNINSQLNISSTSTENSPIHPLDIIPREKSSDESICNEAVIPVRRDNGEKPPPSRSRKENTSNDGVDSYVLVPYLESPKSVELFSDDPAEDRSTHLEDSLSKLAETNDKSVAERNQRDVICIEVKGKTPARKDSDLEVSSKSKSKDQEAIGIHCHTIQYSVNESALGKIHARNNSESSGGHPISKCQITENVECQTAKTSDNESNLGVNQSISQISSDVNQVSLSTMQNLSPRGDPHFISQSFTIEQSNACQKSPLVKPSDLLEPHNHAPLVDCRSNLATRSPFASSGCNFVSPDTTNPVNEALCMPFVQQGGHPVNQAVHILSILDKLTNNAFHDLAVASSLSPTSHSTHVQTPVRPHPRQLFAKCNEEASNNQDNGHPEMQEALPSFAAMKPHFVGVSRLMNRLSDSLKKTVSSLSSLVLCVDEVKTTVDAWIEQ